MARGAHPRAPDRMSDSSSVEPAADQVLEAARLLHACGSYLFFRHSRHFQDPLVPEQWRRLKAQAWLADPVLLGVLESLVARLPGLTPGIYSPVPIARAVADGLPLQEALARFRYELVRVDDRQRWWWQGRAVAPRLRSFFLDHLGWEKSYPLWFFEYRVSDEWFDKCYLDCDVTPLKMISLEETAGRLVGKLESGHEVVLRSERLALDEQERLFAQSESLGPVLFSEALRFRVLSQCRSDLSAVRLGSSWIPLEWPTAAPDAR